MIDLIAAAGSAIFISASCSVAEAVLYSVPWSHIEQLRKQGLPSGRILHVLRTDVEKPITAILTLNTIANTAGASIAGAAAAREFGSDVMGLFAGLFTLAILVFSEILPKTFGVAYSRQLGPILAMPLLILVRIFGPINWIMGHLARLVRGRKKGPEATEEDILSLVSMTRRSGLIKQYEALTISNILSLDDKRVENIMTPRIVVFSLPADATVEEARNTPTFWQHSRIPVYDNDDAEDIVGVVYRRDVLNALANDQMDLHVSDIMRPVSFVLKSLPLDRLLVKLLDSRQHLCVVLDEYGGVDGVVTLEDVLEEILGKEIVDETDDVADMRELARRRRASLTKPK